MKRRDFLKILGVGLAAAGIVASAPGLIQAQLLDNELDDDFTDLLIMEDGKLLGCAMGAHLSMTRPYRWDVDSYTEEHTAVRTGPTRTTITLICRAGYKLDQALYNRFDPIQNLTIKFTHRGMRVERAYVVEYEPLEHGAVIVKLQCSGEPTVY